MYLNFVGCKLSTLVTFLSESYSINDWQSYSVVFLLPALLKIFFTCLISVYINIAMFVHEISGLTMWYALPSCRLLHWFFFLQVFGVGIQNPYRLRPYIGARIPINSSFTPVIQMHNPHSSTIQVCTVCLIIENYIELLARNSESVAGPKYI